MREGGRDRERKKRKLKISLINIRAVQEEQNTLKVYTTRHLPDRDRTVCMSNVE